MVIIGFAIACIVAFLVGSVPTGFIVGLMHGKDIRDHGSGNTGATNALRTLGKVWGALVFLGDALKGWFVTSLGFGIAVSALSVLDPSIATGGAWQNELLRYCIGASVVMGNVWSVFLRFDGGKGVATSFGALFGMVPLVAIWGLVFFILVVIVSRYVSLGSLMGTFSAPLISLFGEHGLGTTLFATTAFLIVLIRHRENIARLKKGTEHKLSFKKIRPAPPA